MILLLRKKSLSDSLVIVNHLSNFILVQFLWLFENRQVWLHDEIFFLRYFQFSRIYCCSICPIWIKFGMPLSYANTHIYLFLCFSQCTIFSIKSLFFELGHLVKYRHLQLGTIYCCSIHPILIKFGTYINAYGCFSCFF